MRLHQQQQQQQVLLETRANIHSFKCKIHSFTISVRTVKRPRYPCSSEVLRFIFHKFCKFYRRPRFRVQETCRRVTIRDFFHTPPILFLRLDCTKVPEHIIKIYIVFRYLRFLPLQDELKTLQSQLPVKRKTGHQEGRSTHEDEWRWMLGVCTRRKY